MSLDWKLELAEGEAHIHIYIYKCPRDRCLQTALHDQGEPLSRFPGSAAGPRTGPVWFFALSPAGCPLMRGVKCLPALVYRPPLLDFDTSLGFAVKASLHHVWLGLACFREFGAGPCRLEDWSPGTLEMCHVRTSREAAPLPEGRPVENATRTSRDGLWKGFL